MTKKYTLPNMEHRFSIQVVGEESGLNWVGDFLYRRPNLRERSSIEAMRVRLNSDLKTLNPDVADFNEAISHLRFTLKEMPDWWRESDNGGALFDANVVIHIYNECAKFEAAWREKIHGKADGVEVKDAEATLSEAAGTPPQP